MKSLKEYGIYIFGMREMKVELKESVYGHLTGILHPNGKVRDNYIIEG